jgi:hypothetical protein
MDVVLDNLLNLDRSQRRACEKPVTQQLAEDTDRI